MDKTRNYRAVFDFSSDVSSAMVGTEKEINDTVRNYRIAETHATVTISKLNANRSDSRLIKTFKI
jgi:hypothetical protein